MRDYEFVIRHTGNQTYIILIHRTCREKLGYPKNLADAMTIMLGHECSEDKKRSN